MLCIVFVFWVCLFSFSDIFSLASQWLESFWQWWLDQSEWVSSHTPLVPLSNCKWNPPTLNYIELLKYRYQPRCPLLKLYANRHRYRGMEMHALIPLLILIVDHAMVQHISCVCIVWTLSWICVSTALWPPLTHLVFTEHIFSHSCVSTVVSSIPWPTCFQFWLHPLLTVVYPVTWFEHVPSCCWTVPLRFSFGGWNTNLF